MWTYYALLLQNWNICSYQLRRAEPIEYRRRHGLMPETGSDKDTEKRGNFSQKYWKIGAIFLI